VGVRVVAFGNRMEIAPIQVKQIARQAKAVAVVMVHQDAIRFRLEQFAH